MTYDYIKALLYAYPVLGELIGSFEVSMENKALLSYKSKGSAFDDVLLVVEEIARMERVQTLKNLVEEVLPLLSEEDVSSRIQVFSPKESSQNHVFGVCASLFGAKLLPPPARFAFPAAPSLFGAGVDGRILKSLCAGVAHSSPHCAGD